MDDRDNSDIDFEIQFYEGVLKHKSDFVMALIALGDLYTKKGLYEQGLMVDQQLVLLRPNDPVIQYNLACSYSRMQKIDEAFAAMKHAVESGYDSWDFLEKDADLANLLQDAEFQRYLARQKKQIKCFKGIKKSV